MNTGTTSTTSRGLRLALRAYPAAYRAERGEEITAVHADSTTGAGRLATARETAGVAAYGLRVRTGLTASGTGGRLLATIAPLAAAMALGQQLHSLWYLQQDWDWQQPADQSPIVHYHFMLIASVIPAVLWLLVVAAGLLRKWTTARVLAALAGVAVIAAWLAEQLAMNGGWEPGMLVDGTDLVLSAGPAAVWALLVFAAPGDLLDSTIPRRPRAAALPFLLLLTGIVQGNLTAFDLPLQDIVTLSNACLLLGLLSLAFLRWGRLLPTATGLTVLPLALCTVVPYYGPKLFVWENDTLIAASSVVVQYLLAVTLVALVAAAAVRYLRPTQEAPSPLGLE
ncbi:hypothetical protein P3T36_000135 [Kitasatospora sp. MAP12-15]|uniref:hypothetical protein n=1 Tax=unclassified Kitasatospora TaxID=2633591 RepID=UPI0024735FC1|nr:hypothetical protein [Kitasatospora sp. MAP12-44]MDH6109363.1 hypothetical protein [Kitasatospora sp. MAP12-44]